MISLLSAYSKNTCMYGYLDPELHPREVTRGEFKFFVNESRKSGGPVLELASGAARVSMILAKVGIRVFGLEASPHMLSIAQEAIAKNLTGDARNRIHLIRGDMCNFYFKRKFPLIIVPFNSFWYNFSRAAHATSPREKAHQDVVYKLAEECLRSILGSLQSEGRFIIDCPHEDTAELWWQVMGTKHGFSYTTFCPYVSKIHRVLVGEKS